MKKIFKNNLFRAFVMLALTIISLYFILKDDYKSILNSLGRISIWWAIGLGAFIFFYQIIIAWILTKLARISTKEYTYGQGLVNALIASFSHGVMPVASGGQIFQLMVFKFQQVKTSDAVSILWMDFIVYQFTMCATVFVLIVASFTTFSTNHPSLVMLVIIGFLINCAIILVLWGATKFTKFYMWISSRGIDIIYKLKIIKDKEKALEQMNTGIRSFSNEGNKLKENKKLIIQIVFANIVRLLVFFGFPYVCAMALHIEVPFSYVIDIMAFTACLRMITAVTPIPGDTGITEILFTTIFTTLLGNTNAASVMIIWRFFSYYFIMIIGGITYNIFQNNYNNMYSNQD